MSIKRYGKTYKNAEEIYNFIKDKKDVVLVSIDELEQKDQRIAELNKRWQELWSLYSLLGVEAFGKDIQKQAKFEISRLQQDNDNLTKKLEQATEIINNPDTLIFQQSQLIENLNMQLDEYKQKLENAIVPKFKVGDTIFAVVTYIDDPKDKTVIESGIVQKIECDKNQIKYWCDNGRIYWEDECEKLFATEQEALDKLKN